MLRAARTRLAGDEEGFTLVEVMLVSAILLVVMGVFFSGLISLTRTEQRSNALVSNEQSARFVLTEMSRDLRAANPLKALPTTSAATYSNRVQMWIGKPPVVASDPPQTLVQWVYDIDPASSTYLTLFRQTLNPTTGAVLTSTQKLTAVRNVERTASDGTPAPVPLLEYRSPTQRDIVVDGIANNTTADVHCANQIQITISANSNPGPEPFTVESDVQLRNQIEGVLGCSAPTP